MLYTIVQAYADAGLVGRQMAAHTHSLLRQNPFFRRNEMFRTLSAACELLSHSAAQHNRPDFRIHKTTVKGVEIDVHEEVVWRNPWCTLVHFRKSIPVDQSRVLLVAPLSGHFATLLRGTVETMLPDHDVFVTDWTNARNVPLFIGPFGMDSSIDIIIACIQVIGPNTHVVAVCQPSVTVLAAATLIAESGLAHPPHSMTLMGGPIDTRINPTAVNTFATGHSFNWFKNNLISSVPIQYLGAFRRVFPGFLQLAGFLAMNPQRHLDAHKKMFDDLVRGDESSHEITRTHYAEYCTVMDLSSDFYLDTVKRVFHEHQLPCGTFKYRGKVIQPRSINATSCLVIEGERDDICGIGQTRAALPLLSGIPDNKKAYHLQKGAGHYAVFHGTKWNDEIYPVLRDFIQKNS